MKIPISGFCISTGEAHSLKGGLFSHAKQTEKIESYLTQWHTEGF